MNNIPLEQSTARINKLDTIIQKLYEDNIEGKISDESFSKMNDSYENEQKQLEARIAELKSQLATEKDIALNTKHFLDLVRRYTDIQELDAEIIRAFVEKLSCTRQNVWMVIKFKESKSSGIVSVNFRHRHHINKNGIVQ